MESRPATSCVFELADTKGGSPRENHPPPPYITVNNANAWIDSDKDGKLDSGEATLTPVVDPITGLTKFQGVDVTADDVTIRFTSVRLAGNAVLDLSGFGAGDKLILDNVTNASTFMQAKTAKPLAAWPNAPVANPVPLDLSVVKAVFVTQIIGGTTYRGELGWYKDFPAKGGVVMGLAATAGGLGRQTLAKNLSTTPLFAVEFVVPSP